jgi:hypothetical protein
MVREVLAMMLEKATGRDAGRDAARGLGGIAGGRAYLNLSAMLWLMDTKALAEEFESLDASAAEVLRTVDPKRYRTQEKPDYLRGIIMAGCSGHPG